jgi:hypothetical protein
MTDASAKNNLALARMIFWREFRAMYRRTALGPQLI